MNSSIFLKSHPFNLCGVNNDFRPRLLFLFFRTFSTRLRAFMSVRMMLLQVEHAIKVKRKPFNEYFFKDPIYGPFFPLLDDPKRKRWENYFRFCRCAFFSESDIFAHTSAGIRSTRSRSDLPRFLSCSFLSCSNFPRTLTRPSDA